MKKKRSLHVKIFMGLISGAVLGLLARVTIGDTPTLAWIVGNIAQPVGQVFLRIIFMAVIPLVVAALALGVAEIGDASRIGRVGLRTLVFTVIFSSIAVMVGISAVDVFQPGAGIDPAERAAMLSAFKGNSIAAIPGSTAPHASVLENLIELIPRNPFSSAVHAFEGGLLPLMVFALFLGVAMALLPEEKMRPLKSLFEATFAVMLKIIDFAMKLAPFGVAGLIFSVAATVGVAALAMLAKYVLVVLGCLIFHSIIVYGAAIRFIARRGVMAFFRDCTEVIVTAFATSSSNATLPVTLKVARENLKLKPEIANFVLTIGASANQNGTALYEGVTVLFLAQFSGVELTLAHQALVVFMCILAGVGTAGVPGGSLPFIMAVLQSIGVPPEGIGLILGTDRILDMSRTVVNVVGDMTIATCVSRTEKA